VSSSTTESGAVGKTLDFTATAIFVVELAGVVTHSHVVDDGRARLGCAAGGRVNGGCHRSARLGLMIAVIGGDDGLVVMMIVDW
jgi:hypothetical protein